MKNILFLFVLLLSLPIIAQTEDTTQIEIPFDSEIDYIILKDKSRIEAEPFAIKDGMLIVKSNDLDFKEKYGSKLIAIPMNNLKSIYNSKTKYVEKADYNFDKLQEINKRYLTDLQLKGSRFSVTGLSLGLIGPTFFGIIAAVLPSDVDPAPRIGLSTFGGILGIIGYSLNLAGHNKMKKSYELKDIQVIDY